MNVEVSQIDTPLTADGTAQGLVTIGSTVGILPGAICQLYQSTGGFLSVTVQVTDIPSSTTLNVRIIAQPQAGPTTGGPQAASTASAPAATLTFNTKPNSGRSNVSAFTMANGARFCQNAQIVRAEPTAQAAPLL
jgi:hypothetical protein